MAVNSEEENLKSENNYQYDTIAKQILSYKSILARVLIDTIDDFRGIEPDEVAALIEMDPMLGSVYTEPGNTNKGYPITRKVRGFNTEDAVFGEGTVRFDLVFSVNLPGAASRVIVNCEIQKSTEVSYSILNRSIFYACRLISSQKERDFVESDYDNIKRVYSIWLCFNQKEDSLNSFSLNERKLIGDADWGGDPDLLNVVIIGFSKSLSSVRGSLHRFLGSIFLPIVHEAEKKRIVREEYGMDVPQSLERLVKEMCNLSEAILEDGIAIGEARGRAEGEAKLITRMLNNGKSIDDIASLTGMTIEEIKSILETANKIQ